MKPQTARKLLKLNYDLYQSQALEWNKSRQSIWEKPVIEFIDKIKPQSSILDLGCGNARLLPQICDRTLRNSHTSEVKSTNTSEMHRDKIDYLGLDPSQAFIDKNKEKYPQAKFQVGDGLNINFKNKFDYIFSIAVLHHIPSEKLQIKFLRNCYNALKKDGVLFLSVWNRWQPRYKKHFVSSNPKPENRARNRYAQALQAGLKSNETIVPWRQSGKARFIHCFTKEELFSLAKKVGFKNINVFYADKYKKTTKNKALNIYLVCNISHLESGV